MSKLLKRLRPISKKLAGQAPLCPWRSAFTYLHPGTLRVFPPAMEIVEVATEGDYKLLEFEQKRRFWFPIDMKVSPELWSEYLVAFWDNRVNLHQYLRGGVSFNSDDVVADCGACEGFFTSLALQNGAKQVICIEPSSVMAECLRKTFKDETATGRVIVTQSALGSHSGTARFASTAGNAFAGAFEEDGNEIVDVTTLTAIANRYGPPTFIKMDLEGTEFQALCGGISLLSESRPKLGVTTYHNAWDYRAVESLLVGVGYRNVKPYGVTLREGSTPRPVMIHAW